MISNKSNKENYKDIREKVLKHLLKQVDNDKALDTLKPDIDWPKRVKETISKFVPSLIERASWLKAEIERVLNSSKRTREQWEQIKDQLARQELPSKADVWTHLFGEWN
jgi:predicted  nucleic acid-binding Zn-ribbon protein